VYGGHNFATIHDADAGLVDRPPRGAAVSRDWVTPTQTPLSHTQVGEITDQLLDPQFVASLEPIESAVANGKTIRLSSHGRSNEVLVLVDADAPVIELIDSADNSKLRFKVLEAGSPALSRLRGL